MIRMSIYKLPLFSVVTAESFLVNYELGKELSDGQTSEFRLRSREFVDRLIVFLVENSCGKSVIAKRFYSICPELLLEGDNSTAFELFTELGCNLVGCAVLTSDEAKASVEEYTSYVVETRRYHKRSGQAASGNAYVIQYLLRDFSFQARHRLLRVFKLCCLVIGMPREKYHVVSLDLSGCSFKMEKFESCVRLVQSYILSAGFSHQTFFTDPTLNAVRGAIAEAGVFFGRSNFCIWGGI